jgi:predicted RNA-binding protein with PUA-like domain
MSLGTSMESVVKSAAWGVAKKQIIKRTILASLMEALWPLAVLKVSKIVDNPFSVAKNRADKAGLVLADALMNKAQGERPVTLIGYSLGARVIYSCLRSLAERRAFGLVESVVLIGAPAPSDANVWRLMRSVVAGRLVNVYSENDYILAFLYRTSSIQYGIAGIQEVQDVGRVENVNVSSMVSGHLRYQYLVGSILEKIGWEDIDTEEVAKEEETLSLLETKEQKEIEERNERGESSDADDDAVNKIEVKKKSDQTTLQWATEKLHLGK